MLTAALAGVRDVRAEASEVAVRADIVVLPGRAGRRPDTTGLLMPS